MQFAFWWNSLCWSANHLVIAKLRKWSQYGNASRKTVLGSKPLDLRIGRRRKPSLENPAIEVRIAFALDQAVRFVAQRLMRASNPASLCDGKIFIPDLSAGNLPNNAVGNHEPPHWFTKWSFAADG